jgi:DegV family protein with EDD domain
MSNKSSRIALVSDSTADIPPALRDQFNIHIIPQLITWGEETFIDGVDLTTEAFYRRLRTDSDYPQTAQPLAQGIVELFDRLAVDHEAIVAPVVSADVSGTVNAINTALKLKDPGIPVHLLDTRCISLGLAYIVLRAAEIREQGGGVEAMLDAAKNMMGRIGIVFTVDNLDALHRGGRIGGATKLLGTALQIKPTLTWEDGHVEPLGRVRTRKKALTCLVQEVQARLDSNQPRVIGVAHADCADEAQLVAAQLQESLSPRMLLVTPITPSIGVHGGTGVIAVIFGNIDDDALTTLAN